MSFSRPHGPAKAQGRTSRSRSPDGDPTFCMLADAPLAKATHVGEAPGVEPAALPTAGGAFPVTPRGVALGRREQLGPPSTAVRV